MVSIFLIYPITRLYPTRQCDGFSISSENDPIEQIPFYSSKFVILFIIPAIRSTVLVILICQKILAYKLESGIFQGTYQHIIVQMGKVRIDFWHPVNEPYKRL